LNQSRETSTTVVNVTKEIIGKNTPTTSKNWLSHY